MGQVRLGNKAPISDQPHTKKVKRDGRKAGTSFPCASGFLVVSVAVRTETLNVNNSILILKS